MISKLITIQTLLAQELQNLYSAENQLIHALPKIAQATTSENLKHAFENHWTQTKNHVQRLRRVANCLEESTSGKYCKVMESLIAEWSELIEERGETFKGEYNDIDAGLICTAQKVNHCKIAAYASVKALAEALDFTEVVEILKQTLKEEHSAILHLTEIAQSINRAGAAVIQRMNEQI